MTDASRKFVTPLSFEVVSQNSVFTDTFQDPLSHISLTSDADLMVIAPATANIVGKFAGGIADDMLSTCFLSFKGKTVIAPAMNWRMYENPVFQKNLGYLASLGVIQVGPEKGSLACGEDAVGRMSDVPDIMEGIRSALTGKDLSGKRIMVTAGPTREYMDPVRFMSNRSSGKMGYAIARAALRRGAEVILISGPSPLKPPSGAGFVAVETTGEMRDAVMKLYKKSTVVIKAAAVADYRPATLSRSKIKKGDADLMIRLERNPDILAEVGRKKGDCILVGFSMETEDLIKNSRAKLLSKKMDMIVANDLTKKGAGFGYDTNAVVIIDADGRIEELPLMSKLEVSDRILDKIKNIIIERRRS